MPLIYSQTKESATKLSTAKKLCVCVGIRDSAKGKKEKGRKKK
jgi:hypothetical protein